MYLLSDGFSRHQLGFNGDEEAEEGSFTQTANSIITTIIAQTPLLTVSKQNWRCGHLKCSINLNIQHYNQSDLFPSLTRQ